MFKVFVELKPVGEFETFQEAFEDFFHKTKELVSRGTTEMILETACFIQYEFTTDENPLTTAMHFSKAKSFAHEAGVLTESGELQDPPGEITESVVQKAFVDATTKDVSAHVDAMPQEKYTATRKLRKQPT